MTVEIRSLAGVSIDALAAAFTAAFSGYAVPMVMTPELLASMLARRGYGADASFGAFAGDDLVGFALTCLDGDRAYNTGTGVVPAWRRRGLSRALLDAVIARIPGRAYSLEVIESNTPAIALYTAAGFATTRALQSWTYAAATEPEPEPEPEPDPVTVPVTVPVVADPAPLLAALAAHADLAPSWQNTPSTLARARERRTVLGDARGAIVVFDNGDTPLLVVARDHRRRGLGTRLLAAARRHAGRALRLTNVDASAPAAAGVAAFFARAGATPLVRQLEMVRRAT